MKDVFDRMKQLDMTTTVTPANHDSEKQAWIEEAKKGHFANPHFAYGRTTIEEAEEAETINLSLLHEVEEAMAKQADPRQRFVSELTFDAIKRQLIVAYVARSVILGDDIDVNKLLESYHGVCSPELIALAEGVAFRGETIPNVYLDGTPQITTQAIIEKYTDDPYTPSDMKHTFEAVLEDYGLTKDWTVIIDDSHSAITVDAADKTHGHALFIPTTRKPEDVFKVLQLAAHEIETHIRHNANCIKLFMSEFGLSEEAATKLECFALQSPYIEGLAKIADALVYKKCFGDTSGAPHPWYILAATQAAKGESFGRVAEFLHAQGKSLEFCWKITTRVFRGCTDTSNPHRFSRQADRSYMEGYVKAIEKCEDMGVFNYAKFNDENIKKLEVVLGKPLADVSPRLRFLDVTEKIIRCLYAD